MADNSRGEIVVLRESTWNTAAVPSLTNKATRLLFTSDSLEPSLQYEDSKIIQSNRDVASSIFVGQTVSGDINTELTKSDEIDLFLESVVGGTFTSDVLINGDEEHSYTIERKHELGTSDDYNLFTGCRVDMFTINLSPKEIVTSSIKFIGGKMARSSTSFVTDQTFINDEVNPQPLDASSGLSTLTIGSDTGYSLKSLTIEIKNRLRGQDAIGVSGFRGIGYGSFDVMCNFEVYHEDGSLFDASLDDTSQALSFTIGTTNQGTYAFDMGTVKVINYNAPNSGSDSDIIGSGSFRATYDLTDERTLQITRS